MLDQKLILTLYIFLFGSTVAFKFFSVRKKIKKSPILLTTHHFLAEAWLKKAIFPFFLAWMGGILWFSWHGVDEKSYLFPPQLSLTVIGLSLLFLSWGLFVLALWQMKEAWRVGIDSTQKNLLVTTGIYSYIRHPIYTSLKISIIAILLIFPHVYFLILFFPAYGGTTMIALLEEDFLISQFGEMYKQYMKTTHRFWYF
ncbi:MAG: hypothetical protein A3G32_00775 [Deltaproteobacteria bacterium RIFCSPLOWO2_12_FULL_40_28]|nr:MAG: hypothetical protein A3C45_09660 [Deltaproteobacteria bacterium RIFCSPHIGHO2_02_FULL_40_28]OGQ19874.1 MAG: hypothetical protein A3E27_06610 [Deltaproteobacteria bacterium RIFCSPHIGHO2_12_FULL_40_32]OGQ39633.1 MAG: hypothetical protein A3I69_06040 [Deltaproteobacteria bacterium RIFCSPLOWO2_02_FULL_40_36]OGQ52889.1 MAG: hypothetical protein A3G32_00775 [Deltaproteobacteria bacterium RIFCSPLOWO2_12_FULL_40_28]